MIREVKFESQDRRIKGIIAALNANGIKDIEEANAICEAAGLDPYKTCEETQPICFENAKWAYVVGAAIALKKGCKNAADAAEAIGIGLQAFCIPGSVADDRKVGIGHGNLAVRDLYLKQITGMQYQEALPKTTLETDKAEYDLGTVKEGTTKKQTVTVRNTGTSVFKLKGFTTSCDCTEATCDWKELQPGESGTVTVSYEAEQPGDFYRTVEIYGNIPNNSLMVSFIGTVQ